MTSPVSTKKGRSPYGYAGAAAAAISHVAAATRSPNPTLPNAARLACALGGLGRPFSRTAKAAAMVIQSPDQASAPSASDGRCQPANRTAVENVELMHPAATASHGLQRDDETKIKLKASEVPMVACPLGYVSVCIRPSSKRSFGTSARQGSLSLRTSAPMTANPNPTTAITPTKVQRRLANKVEHVGVQLYDFPTQRFAAKIRVVIELMSPGGAYKNKIA